MHLHFLCILYFEKKGQNAPIFTKKHLNKIMSEK